MADSSYDDDQNQIRLILIGKTGEGKSSLGNTILGRPQFTAKVSARSVTQTTSWREVTYADTKLRIVDTPGFFDTRDFVKSKEDWLTNEILKSTVLSVPGPHAFLYVVQIGRLTEEDINSATKMFDLFGKKAYDFVIIIFTHADVLRDDKMELKDFINDLSGYFAQLCRDCNNRVLSIDNKYGNVNEKQTFIEDLLRLVKQMNKNRYYTNKTTQDASRLFFAKVQEVQQEKKASYEEAKQIVLKDVQEEGTFFKLLKSGSFGVSIAAMVAGLITFFTPAGMAVTAAVAGTTGIASAAAMVKDKCSIM